MRRTVPNLPGALIHHMRRSLAIDPTTAMRVALLYGDLEWQAEGASELRWSARDYARRHRFSRNTVRADLERLQRHGAISIEPDGCERCTYRLHGLGAGSADEQPFGRDPGSPAEPPPGSSPEPPSAQPVSHPWLSSCATLQKNFQKEEKRRGKRSSRKTLSLNSRIRFGAKASKPAPRSSRPEGESSAEDSPSQGQDPAQAQKRAQDHEGAEAQDPATATLLADLLACFQRGCPAEWIAPQRLSLTRGRSARLRRAVDHAGGAAELKVRLEQALAQVPPWFRRTYPLLPDGSRRPPHQFFDLLFRATGAERDSGPEAWHLFAWSERAADPPPGGSTRPEAAAGSPAADEELARALALFAWDGHHWRGQGVAALQLSRDEKRRLAERLEAAGYGQPGAAARQYGEPDREGETQSTPAAAS